MTEEEFRLADIRSKRWNTWIALAGAIGVVLSILVGFSQVTAQSEAQVTALNQQWKQQFYRERLELYRRATETAARIATLKTTNASTEQLDGSMREFYTLFWGPMAMTEEAAVESAMVKFKAGLDRNLDGRTLQTLALYLAHVARNETNSAYLEGQSASSGYGTNAEILSKMAKLVEKVE